MNDEHLCIRRTLAADYRSNEFDPANDQVWELNFTGDPPAIALHTTYGLRSGGMQIHPSFTFQGITLTDPRTFAQPIRILKRTPEFILLECAPFNSLDVQMEFWVPSAQVICGRIKFSNTVGEPTNFIFNWTSSLKILEKGEPMRPTQMGVNTVLQGKTDGLFPVFFMTGGPEANQRAQSALEAKVTLSRGGNRRLSWALATLDSAEASFTMAKQFTSLAWEVETLKSEMREKNTSVQVELENGQITNLVQESQVKACQTLLRTPPPAKRLTFLTRRRPDAVSFSTQGNRKSFLSFSQINAYDMWKLSRILLPGNPAIFKEIIQFFIDNQQDNGAIPWTINPDGVATQVLTPPLLADLVCEVHPYVEDMVWLEQVYPPLLRAFRAWFAPEDGSPPAWRLPLQTGMEFSPLYDIIDGLGMDPHALHSPALDALLIREAKALQKIAGYIHDDREQEWIAMTLEKLAKALDSCWDEERRTYTYRDIQSGENWSGELLHEFNHEGVFKLKRNFKVPRRLMLRTVQATGSVRTVKVKLVGRFGEDEQVEELRLRSHLSDPQTGAVISNYLFSRLESVEISGMKRGTVLRLELAGNDTQDISLLLPIWSGEVSPPRVQTIIDDTLLPRYLTVQGLACFPVDMKETDQCLISPFWNEMIAEALIFAGHREISARVLGCFLDAQSGQWQQNGSCSSLFTADGLSNRGELDTLAGLMTLQPLLHAAGLERISGDEIILNGLNEYLPPFTVKYKGIGLELSADKTVIRSVAGDSVEISNRNRCKIVLS